MTSIQSHEDAVRLVADILAEEVSTSPEDLARIAGDVVGALLGDPTAVQYFDEHGRSKGKGIRKEVRPMSDVHTWPIDQRPPIWVHIDGERHPGREHARHGPTRLVAWGHNYRWLPTTQVTPRDDDDT